MAIRCTIVSRHFQLTTAENVAWNCTFLRTELDFFAIFSSTFSSYFVSREKGYKNSLSLPMTMSFFAGHFVRKFWPQLVPKSLSVESLLVREGPRHNRSLYKIMKINGWKFASQRKSRSSIKRSFWFANYSTTFQRVQVRWYARLRGEYDSFVVLWCFGLDLHWDDNFLGSTKITNTLTVSVSLVEKRKKREKYWEQLFVRFFTLECSEKLSHFN